MSSCASLSRVIVRAFDSIASSVTSADDVLDTLPSPCVTEIFRIATSDATVPPLSISYDPEIKINLYLPSSPAPMVWEIVCAATAPPSVSVKSSILMVVPVSTLSR